MQKQCWVKKAKAKLETPVSVVPVHVAKNVIF